MATKLGTYIVADFNTALSAKVAVGDTTATLQSATDDDSVSLPSGRYLFTIDGGNSSKEYISCDLSSTALTNIKSVSRQGVETTGFARTHRVGATVVATDFGTLRYLNDLLVGNTNLNASIPLGYDGTPTISSSTQIATKGYVDSVVTGGTVNTDAVVLATQTAGETVSAGKIVYLKASDSRWWLADKDTLATFQDVKLGVSLGSATAGNIITNGGVQILGKCSSFTGLTANTTYYLGASGAVSTSAGTYSVVLGVATSTTAMTFAPQTITNPTVAIIDANPQLTYSGTISANKAIYINSSGQIAEASAATYATANFFGFTISSGVSTDVKAIKMAGRLGGFSSLTAGQTVYLSDTAGAVSTTPGTIPVAVGYALSSTEILISPRPKTFVKRSQVFTSSGTFTKPQGIDLFEVECLGGGSSGNLAAGNVASGGGAGAYTKKTVNLAGTTTTTVTIGAGGAASSSVVNNGGNTTFGAFLTGAGAIASAGGVASGGDINIDGQAGWSNSGTTTTGAYGGGGNSPLGFGTGGQTNPISGGNALNSNNRNAVGYGAGGTGNTSGSTSGSGSGGLCIVSWYE